MEYGGSSIILGALIKVSTVTLRDIITVVMMRKTTVAFKEYNYRGNYRYFDCNNDIKMSMKVIASLANSGLTMPLASLYCSFQ